MMKLNIIKSILLVILSLLLGVNTNMMAHPKVKPLNTKVCYVGSNMAGNGSGDSREDAADFLNPIFWAAVQKQLVKTPVTVQFLAGEYNRAYIEKPLILKGFGYEKNLLTLEGVKDKTIFVVDPAEFDGTKSILVDVVNSQNILIKNLAFTGNGKLGYALRITSTKGEKTENIVIDNCDWYDMRGIIYGTTGVHQKGTKNVTYRNCTFKRVGIDSHSHHIYNAYNPSHIYVIDSHFEDCTGDYVRFRDSTDFCVVKGSKFVRNKEFPPYPFISMPTFSKERRETFASNYVFVDNQFINNGANAINNGIAMHHYGHNKPGYNFLLTKEEGALLTNGVADARKKLLLKNFGVNTELMRVYNNIFTGDVKNKVAIGSFARYGAESKGWEGFASIYDIIRTNNTPFSWERIN